MPAAFSAAGRGLAASFAAVSTAAMDAVLVSLPAALHAARNSTERIAALPGAAPASAISSAAFCTADRGPAAPSAAVRSAALVAVLVSLSAVLDAAVGDAEESAAIQCSSGGWPVFGSESAGFSGSGLVAPSSTGRGRAVCSTAGLAAVLFSALVSLSALLVAPIPSSGNCAFLSLASPGAVVVTAAVVPAATVAHLLLLFLVFG